MANGKGTCPVFIVDAFTEQRFAGNQAAVCLIDQELESDLYQKIAAEFNLSETVFPIPLVGEKGDSSYSLEEKFRLANRFSLRWFTPTKEVPLCGHATLATALVLFNEIGNVNKSIVFDTLSGPLSVKRVGEGLLEMDFPAFQLSDPTSHPSLGHISKQMADTIVGSGNWAHLAYATTGHDRRLIVALKSTISRAEFESLKPSSSDLLQFDPTGVHIHGVVLTASPESATKQGYADQGHGEQAAVDYACRYFAPWVGVYEDPACGSAQCALAPYWADRLKKGNTPLRGVQCYPGRGGDFIVQLSTDQKRVLLRGKAVAVVRGRMEL